jgi:Na+(H+)/acetate symporter ActP
MAAPGLVAVMPGSGERSAVLLDEPAIWTVPLAFLAMVVGSLVTRRTLPADVTGKLLALHLPEHLQRRRAAAASFPR